MCTCTTIIYVQVTVQICKQNSDTLAGATKRTYTLSTKKGKPFFNFGHSFIKLVLWGLVKS